MQTEVPMQRIGLGVLLALSLMMASLSGEAQQPGKVYRILSPHSQWQEKRMSMRSLRVQAPF